MAQSFSKIIIHIIFSTKLRENLIPESILDELFNYIGGTCREHKCHPVRIGGTSNHIHIACYLDRSISIAKLVQEVKSKSSRWLKSKEPKCLYFSWQAGYGAFSIGQSQVINLTNYIENQKEHHKSTTFKDEFLAFLKKYKVDYDANTIWL